MPTPIALTIAGSDPSGGAGLQADLKTFTTLGVYGASIVTALTAQSTRGVIGVMGVGPEFITLQFEAVATDLAISAAKTGMLGDTATVVAVAGEIRRRNISPLVVDPVMVATSGDILLAPDAIDAVRRMLLPLATVVTPNLPEAAKLLDIDVARTEDEMLEQARRLLELGSKAVLIKGGHASGEEAVDLLVEHAHVMRLARPRIATRNTHGTGCTLAAALAAHLALGADLRKAAEAAKDFVWRALDAGKSLEIGHGAGPVDHLHAIRQK